MHLITRALCAGTAFLAAVLPLHAQGRATVPIAIETTLGTIEAVLDSAHAPITTVNILRYIDAQAYDSATVFRSVRLDNQPNDSVKIEVIQLSVARGRGRGIPPIPLERTSVTGLHHEDGVLSMARSGPDTGTSSFSIVINAQPQMDFGGKRQPDGQGFAVFGRVTRGMDIVRKIQNQPVQAQRLETPVMILRIVRR
jgi:peptidyl-prolyl cis-trans isomerase A (cyclophilin A)